VTHKSIAAVCLAATILAEANAGPDRAHQVDQCQLQVRCCRNMDPESQRMAQERQEFATAIGWSITGVLGVAVAVGIGKLGLELRKNVKSLEQPKEPWERAWTQRFEGPRS
jgi:hypothetical protein